MNNIKSCAKLFKTISLICFLLSSNNMIEAMDRIIDAADQDGADFYRRPSSPATAHRHYRTSQSPTIRRVKIYRLVKSIVDTAPFTGGSNERQITFKLWGTTGIPVAIKPALKQMGTFATMIDDESIDSDSTDDEWTDSESTDDDSTYQAVLALSESEAADENQTILYEQSGQDEETSEEEEEETMMRAETFVEKTAATIVHYRGIMPITHRYSVADIEQERITNYTLAYEVIAAMYYEATHCRRINRNELFEDTEIVKQYPLPDVHDTKCSRANVCAALDALQNATTASELDCVLSYSLEKWMNNRIVLANGSTAKERRMDIFISMLRTAVEHTIAQKTNFDNSLRKRFVKQISSKLNADNNADTTYIINFIDAISRNDFKEANEAMRLFCGEHSESAEGSKDTIML